MRNNRIYLCLAHMSGKEQDYIKEAFDTNWVVPLGPNVEAFEEDLKEFMGGEKEVVALSSGTAAIHIGLLMAGVRNDDEVICQSFTFCASANPITYLGAKPIFVDSENDTWNISPILLEKAIIDRIEKKGVKPKAIVIVHLYGIPAKMKEISDIAEKYNIPIIEDAAEALGSLYDEKECGTLGTFGAISFNGNKMITTSGGGAMICNNKDEKKKAMFYATQARENVPYYEHKEIGYNYRMSNICAGIGRGQMSVLKIHIDHHRMLHEFYKKAFKTIDGVNIMPCTPNKTKPNFWLSTILIDKEETGKTPEELRIALDKENIESRPLWKPMHMQPIYCNNPFYGDGTSERLFNSGLCIPSGPMVTKDDAQFVVNKIKSIIEMRR